MFKRLFFALLGLGAGVTLGVYAVRKVEATRARLSPQQLGSRAGTGAESLRRRVAGALEVGRAAAAVKEAELREVYRVRTGDGA